MVDPQTQAYVNQMRQYALGATGIGGAQAGGATPSGGPLAQAMQRLHPPQTTSGGPMQMPMLPPEIAQAQQQYQDYARGGNLGFSALTGNADAAQQFMNPYLSQMNPFFAQQRAQAVEGANQQATLAGAFGGDRSQIGAAAAGNYVDQNQAMAQIQAFEQAMQRAGSAANLGYGASAQAAFLPQQYHAGQLGLLNAGMGPYGQTQTTKMSSDPFSQLLGLGLTFGPMLFGAPPGVLGGGQQILGNPAGYGGYG